MLKSSLAGLVGACATVTLAGTPALAGGCCDCYPGYGYGAYAVGPAYGYSPRVAYYQYPGAYYYNPVPPAPVYGYAYINRGPAAVIVVPPRARWRRGWGW